MCAVITTQRVYGDLHNVYLRVSSLRRRTGHCKPVPVLVCFCLICLFFPRVFGVPPTPPPPHPLMNKMPSSLWATGKLGFLSPLSPIVFRRMYTPKSN